MAEKPKQGGPGGQKDAESEILERKEYLASITIIEARNILGKDWQGTSDPFVKVRCAGVTQ